MKPAADYADLFLTAVYFGYLLAAAAFCKKYLDASKKEHVVISNDFFCGWLFFEAVNKRYAIPYMLLVTLHHMFFMRLILLLFRADREKKALAAAMLIAAITLAGNFCESFLSCLALLFLHIVKKIPEPVLGEWEIELIGCAGICMAAGIVCWLSRRLASVFSDKPKKWHAILSAPLFLVIAVIDLAGWGASNGIIVTSGGNLGLYYDQLFSHAEFCVLALLSVSAIGFYVFGMDRIYLEQEKSGRYHAQLAVYKMLEEQNRQSKRLRHDMKNHILALSGLFQSKEWEKMGDYLKRLEDSGLESGGDMTGNKAVDALLRQKRKQAKRERIQWECDVQTPHACGIQDFDFCVLFGNLLDNALEACERMQSGESRFISVRAKTVKKCYLIEVRNSMSRSEKFTKKTHLPEHGIGLLNVRDVACRYNGTMHMEAENGVFVISILLPLCDDANS